jgi:hypothetical protein
VRDNNKEKGVEDVHATDGDHGNMPVLQLTLEISGAGDDMAFLITNVMLFNVVVLDRRSGRFLLVRVLDIGGRHDMMGKGARAEDPCWKIKRGFIKA